MKRISILFVMACVTMALFAVQPVKKNNRKEKSEKVDSVAIILEQARKGNAAAQNTVGLWYYTGKDTIKQDYQKALEWWARSAKQDNADAIGNMAICYQLGKGTTKDSLMAVNLYESAIKKGNKAIIPQHETIVNNTGSVFSSLLLHECYQKGIGVGKNPKKAATYLEKAAEGGDKESQYAIALYYLNTNQDTKAVEWFKKAAKQEHVGATYYYGNLLFNGKGINKNQENGLKLLKIAADKGFTMANYQVGRIFFEGDGVTKDVKTAVSYLSKAAAKGNDNAKWILGLCYLNGEGVNQDFYFAAQWLSDSYKSHTEQFNELLKKDNEGAFSQYLMGLRNYYVDKDIESAIKCFTKVEKNKNIEGTTMLGVCYGNKDYKKRNEKKAIKTLIKAAEVSAVANYYLSSMYETGTGVDKNEQKALELLKKAADLGVAYAQCKLGDKYMSGDGVARDLTKAALLYLDAEAQNHLTPSSAKNLAECYKQKVKVLPDLADAENRIKSLNKQKANGNLIELLKLLEK